MAPTRSGRPAVSTGQGQRVEHVAAEGAVKVFGGLVQHDVQASAGGDVAEEDAGGSAADDDHVGVLLLRGALWGVGGVVTAADTGRLARGLIRWLLLVELLYNRTTGS